MHLLHNNKNIIIKVASVVLFLSTLTFINNSKSYASTELLEWFSQMSADETLSICNSSRGVMINQWWCQSPGLLRDEINYSHASWADFDSQQRPLFFIYKCVVKENGDRRYSIQRSANRSYIIELNYRSGRTFPEVYEGRLDSATDHLLRTFDAIMPDACKR